MSDHLPASLEALVEDAAQSDAAFDGRPWLSMPRSERDRYIARSRAALAVVAPAWAVMDAERDALRAELAALKADPPAEPEGWRLVPVEPTEAMLTAADKADRDYTDRQFGPDFSVQHGGAYDHYVAMLAAAPAPGDTNP